MDSLHGGLVAISQPVHLRALVVLNIGERRALPGQRFITDTTTAVQLLKLGKALLLDEADMGRIADRESHLAILHR